MTHLNLKSIHNPSNIIGLIDNNNTHIEKTNSQAFQETKGRYEIWEEINGLLFLIKRWNKNSITIVFTK